MEDEVDIEVKPFGRIKGEQSTTPEVLDIPQDPLEEIPPEVPQGSLDDNPEDNIADFNEDSIANVLVSRGDPPEGAPKETPRSKPVETPRSIPPEGAPKQTPRSAPSFFKQSVIIKRSA